MDTTRTRNPTGRVGHSRVRVPLTNQSTARASGDPILIAFSLGRQSSKVGAPGASGRCSGDDQRARLQLRQQGIRNSHHGIGRNCPNKGRLLVCSAEPRARPPGGLFCPIFVCIDILNRTLTACTLGLGRMPRESSLTTAHMNMSDKVTTTLLS